MDYKKLFHKIISLFSSPGKTWTEISEGGEERNIQDSFDNPLIGLCCMAEFIGAFLGRDITPVVFQNDLRSCFSMSLALFVGFFLAVYLIDLWESAGLRLHIPKVCFIPSWAIPWWLLLCLTW